MFKRGNLTQSLRGLGIEPYKDIFDDLAKAYGDDKRHYHTGNHIAELLAQFVNYRDISTRPHEIEVAIWFHDTVYDTHKNDNEEQSARWAEEYLSSEGADPETIDRISNMIRATKSHEPDSTDSALLVDMDLSILGAPIQAFEAYDKAIRREYTWVPEDLYKIERAKVLQSFLNRDVIYRTNAIRDRLEVQAHANLARKIDEMRS